MKGLTKSNFGIVRRYHISNPYWPKYISWSVNLLVVYVTWTTERDGWARLFGSWYGIHWKHRDNMLMYSERCGKTKSVVLFNYRFRILKPSFYTWINLK